MPVPHSTSNNVTDNNNTTKLDVTQDEWHRFQSAMKSAEFRQHLADYAREISDPENRRRYEAEIAQLERERGNDIIWLHPAEGYVVKLSPRGVSNATSDVQGKIFINICSSNELGVAQCSARDGGHQWSVPHCVSGPVRDCDKNGAVCSVCDVIFHPDTLYMAGKNVRMRQLIEQTAVDAVARVCGINLDARSAKYPNMRYKGARRAAMLRRARVSAAAATQGASGDDLAEHVRQKLHVSDAPVAPPVGDITPQYTLTYRENASISDTAASVPGGRCLGSSSRQLVVSIKLPTADTADGLDLQVSERQLLLIGAGYRLKLQLPQSVAEEGGRARFNVAERCMVVELPLLVGDPGEGKSSDRSEEMRRHDSGVVLDAECEENDGCSSPGLGPGFRDMATLIDRSTESESSLGTSVKLNGETPVLSGALSNQSPSPILSAISASPVGPNNDSEHEAFSDVCALPDYELFQDDNLFYIQLYLSPTDSLQVVVDADKLSLLVKAQNTGDNGRVCTNYRLVLSSPSLQLSSAREQARLVSNTNSLEPLTVTVAKISSDVCDLKVGVTPHELTTARVPFKVFESVNKSEIISEMPACSVDDDVFEDEDIDAELSAGNRIDAIADGTLSNGDLRHSAAETSVVTVVDPSLSCSTLKEPATTPHTSPDCGLRSPASLQPSLDITRDSPLPPSETSVIGIVNPPVRRLSGSLVRGILKKSSSSGDFSPEDEDEAVFSEPTWPAASSTAYTCDERKAVHFSSHVTEKRYRSDCSIVQDRGRLQRQRAKKRRQRVARRRVNSEGDTSETDDQLPCGGDWRSQCHLAEVTALVSSSDVESSDAELSEGGSSSGGDVGLSRVAQQPGVHLSKTARKKMHKMGRKRKCDVRNRLALADDE